jgi:hypothetical protein
VGSDRKCSSFKGQASFVTFFSVFVIGDVGTILKNHDEFRENECLDDSPIPVDTGDFLCGRAAPGGMDLFDPRRQLLSSRVSATPYVLQRKPDFRYSKENRLEVKPGGSVCHFWVASSKTPPTCIPCSNRHIRFGSPHDRSSRESLLVSERLVSKIAIGCVNAFCDWTTSAQGAFCRFA